MYEDLVPGMVRTSTTLNPTLPTMQLKLDEDT